MKVELLYFAGCPNVDPARKMIEEVLSGITANIEFAQTEIKSEEQAQNLSFVGSPTVLVNGDDIEPAGQDIPSGAMSCRRYEGESGVEGIPSSGKLRAALKRGGVV